LNRGQNALDISEHIVVPESEHPITFLAQAAIPNYVSYRFIVLPAVDFDY
jgi:hypothetical protein